jgi:hypothetical protein
MIFITKHDGNSLLFIIPLSARAEPLPCGITIDGITGNAGDGVSTTA